jgi:hypothetical protein
MFDALLRALCFQVLPVIGAHYPPARPYSGPLAAAIALVAAIRSVRANNRRLRDADK